MSQDSPKLSECGQRLEQVLGMYVRSEESGQPLDHDKLLAEHPDLADDLRSFFRNRAAVEHLAKPLIAAAETPTIGLEAAAVRDPNVIRYFGDYELLSEIARGGMGVVYKARQRSLGRLVALKMILAGQLASAADVQRFRQEAEAAANLDHLGIVPIFEIGEHEGQHYFSMKLIEGGSLRDKLLGRRSGFRPDNDGAASEPPNRASQAKSLTYDQREAAKLMAAVARAVHHAHQRGVLHRDLKPGNILVDADGRPHITDFGLAKRVESGSDLTQSGAVLGTPAYMAPEQSRAKKQLTTAADIYSLGAILYELLTARPPFQGDSPGEVLHAALNDEPQSPRSINPSINRDLEIICLKCLEKDPQRRYDSAAAFAADLERFLDGRPIIARPASRVEYGWRWCRRNPVVAALSGFAIALLVAVAVVAIIAYQRESGLRRIADEQRQAIERQSASLHRGLFELGAAETTHGDPAKGTAILATAFEATSERDPLRESVGNLLSAAVESAPIRLPHSAAVVNAVYRPDGLTVLTVTRDGTSRLWDSRTGKPLGEPTKHDDWVPPVAYSPDGATLLTTGSNMTAWLWDARSGMPLGKPLKHDGWVQAVAYSPDGATVLTGSTDNSARLWDARTGKPLGEPMKHEGAVTAVAYSPDGAAALTGSADTTARLWDSRSGKPLGEPMRHNSSVLAVAYSPDGATVLTGNAGRTALLWDARTGKPLGKPMKHDNYVVAVAYSPDGTSVLTGSWDQTARLWDARTGEPVGEPMKHEGQVLAVAYSPDGATVLTGSEDDAARLWTARRGKPLGEPMRHGNFVQAVAYSPDGATVLTGSRDKSARQWDVRTGRPLREPMKHDGEVWAVAYSPDGASVLTGSYDQTARLWDARTGKPLGKPMKHDNFVVAVAFSPDGTSVLTGSWDQTARLWDARTGEPVGEPMKHESAVEAVAFSPDGATVLTGSTDHTARLWDSRTRKPLGKPMRHDDAVSAVAYSPDGATVMTGSEDKTARLWDSRTGEQLGDPIKHDEPVLAVAYSPDGMTVLTGSKDCTARLWDARTGKPLREPMKFNGWVMTVAYSPDGASVLTGGGDKRVLLWPVAPPVPKRLISMVVATRNGMKMNDQGQIQPLSISELSETWDALEAQGADWLGKQRTIDQRRQVGWHHYEAAEAEGRGDWFAAEFHLRWLLKSESDDADLMTRHEHAKQAIAAARAAREPLTPKPADVKK